MANYGLAVGGVIGSVPFSGWSPTLGTGPANAGAAAGAVYNNGITQFDAQIVRMLRVRGGRRLRQLMQVLNGTVPGQTAFSPHIQVKAQIGAPGGLQAIEAVFDVNRLSTAADVTAINALLTRTTYPATYPPDLSGNGGGGQLAYVLNA